MGILISEIKTGIWSLSLKEQGKVVTGLDDIKQCIHVILTTVQGSDPMRPAFAMPNDLIDKPITNVAAIIKAIADALATWETRITVTKITSTITGLASVKFRIEWVTVQGVPGFNELTYGN
jgi:phage baseplate assembly protein W